MLPIELSNDRPLEEIVEYNDDSSDMEVDVTFIAESSITHPSFAETSIIQPSFTQ